MEFVFSIISEIVEATILEKRNDAKDESVEAVFQSILRQKSLDIRDKKAAIVDFIAAGIHTVRTCYAIFFPLHFHAAFVFTFTYLPCHFLCTARKHFGVPVRLNRAQSRRTS